MVQEAHHSILNQLVVMEPYVDKHLEEIYAAHDGQHMEAWVQKQHKGRTLGMGCMGWKVRTDVENEMV